MKGWIVNFRLGRNKYYPRQMIIEVEGVGYKDFHRLIGRKVVWNHPVSGEKFIGRIVKQHGKRGRVIAYFRKQLPGQAIGTEVEVL